MYVDPSGEQDTYPGGVFPPEYDPWNKPWKPEGGGYPGAAGPGFNNGLGYTYNEYGGYGNYGGNFTYNSSTGMNGLGGLIVFGGILIYDLIKKGFSSSGTAHYNDPHPTAYIQNYQSVSLQKYVGGGASTVYQGNGKNNGGGLILDNSQKYQFPSQLFAGLSATTASEIFYSDFFGTWMGKDFKFRTIHGRTGNGNQHVGGKYKFGKAMSNVFKWVNWGVTGYNAIDLIKQRYIDETINDYQFVSEETSNGLSVIPIWGTVWGAGWEIGRSITYTSWYQKSTFQYWYNQAIKQWGVPSEYNHLLWDQWLENRFKYYYKSF
ncbi:MAG: hypothetical protein VB046_02270 [Paludibacter sp.]|nr:hypothetical protein [Paludibacter sp.]